MFNYSIKVKVFAILLLIAITVAIIVFTNNSKSKGFDLYTISYAKNLATSLENYFDDNYSYPEISQTNLANIKVITETGVNKQGENIYFRQSKKTIDGTLVSTAERYVIEVNLANSWDLWGIGKNGGSCRISNNLEMACRSNN